MVGFSTGGTRTSTINVIFYGENEPATACLQRKVREWIQTWQREAPAHDRLRQGWDHVIQRFKSMGPRGRWNSVTGPMGALILPVQQLGWNPNQPDEWGDSRGSIWKFKGDDELDFCKDIMRAVVQGMEAQGSGPLLRQRHAAPHGHDHAQDNPTEDPQSRPRTRSRSARSPSAWCNMGSTTAQRSWAPYRRQMSKMFHSSGHHQAQAIRVRDERQPQH
eukprot:9471219-Pyramimonas_sp.AAC.1